MFNNIKRKLLISFLTLFVLSLVYLFPTNKQFEETLKFKEAKYHSIYLLNKKNRNIYQTSWKLKRILWTK